MVRLGIEWQDVNLIKMQTCRLTSQVVCVNWHTPTMREMCRIEGVVKMQSTKEDNSKTVVARQRDKLRGRPLVDSTNEHGGGSLMKLEVNNSFY